MKYECHITTEFVSPTSADYGRLCGIAKEFKFAVAKLYKANKQTSDLDTFMTGHSDSFEDMKQRMESLCAKLKLYDFPVIRYKIEEILLDSRRGG